MSLWARRDENAPEPLASEYHRQASRLTLRNPWKLPTPAKPSKNCMSSPIEQHGSDVLVRIKVVPGASRNEIAGTLGDRIKVRVSAAPEAGKANKAVCELLAKTLGIKANQVSIEVGQTNPEKTARIAGAEVTDVRTRLM